jgi:hypothetical protein
MEIDLAIEVVDEFRNALLEYDAVAHSSDRLAAILDGGEQLAVAARPVSEQIALVDEIGRGVGLQSPDRLRRWNLSVGPQEGSR